MEEVKPILKIHCFTDVGNFTQYLRSIEAKGGDFAAFNETQNGIKALESACCNKGTFQRIAKEIYLSMLETNKNNEILWNLLKTHTNTDKLLFMQDGKEVLTV